MLPGIWAGAVPRGPLLFSDEPGAARRLVQEMIAAARRHHVRLLIVQPPEGSPTLVDAMQAAGFRNGAPSIAPEATLRLDLRRSEKEILQGLHPKRRNRIRASLRSDFETSSSDDIEAFHRLHVATAARNGFRPISMENLKAQWDILAPLGMCRILLTRLDGVPLAGKWLTSFAGVITGKLNGCVRAQTAPEKYAAVVAIWAAILWGRREGARYLDFGGFDRRIAEDLVAGRPPAPEFANSASHFKWTFGGDVVLLPQAQFIFPDRLVQLTLAGLAQRALTSRWAQRFAQRMRGGQRRPVGT